ncbi:DUF1330 domain-containing protein [Microvirga sp. CF3062]|uniref:DUF1330 domain-containing protein n=1 Tax=Microvirga sp. CF3062 TaxID=3110182 RepID=UPI002E7723A4|nr:DUF1330 domain-containing protein [Microvirga sp. CF3062]MEE1656927.1 DUF1330 domain-containing protein [Microvirga sp. CF3062]
MTAYIIAQLKFTDLDSYRKYQRAFPKVFGRFRGTIVIADEHPRLLEGHWERDKVVVLSFPSEEDALAFQNSDEYRLIARDRKAGAEATILLVRQFS